MPLKAEGSGNYESPCTLHILEYLRNNTDLHNSYILPGCKYSCTSVLQICLTEITIVTPKV